MFVTRKLFRRRSSATRDERGAVMVLVAVTLPVVILFVAFGVEVGHWFDYSRNLQNRADAAALAAGDEYGDICGQNPTTASMAPIGMIAQLYSGPPGPTSDLYYPYSGTGSPLAQFPSYSTYQNQPNLNRGSASNYHVLLNSMGYWNGTTPGQPTSSTQSFTMTDTNTGQSTFCDSSDGQDTGPMADVKVTQDHLPLFFSLFGFQPTISAHARVEAQGVSEGTNLKPLFVRDPGTTPCVAVKFIPVGGTGAAPASKTIELQPNQALNTSTGPIVWDNSQDAGGGDNVHITSGWNLYMQTILYAQGAGGTCDPTNPSNPATYESGSGILYLNSYPTTTLGTLPNNASPQIDTGGVTLAQNGTCTPDQYFSSSGNCGLQVTAHIAFAGNAGTKTVTAVDTVTGASITLAPQGANTYSGTGLTVNALSGQHPICIQVSQTGGASGKSPCPMGPNSGSAAIISLGVQQQAFAACDEDYNSCTDPNASGPITFAEISEGANSTVGAFPVGDHTLTVRLKIQGLQDANPSDRCANSANQCTILRLNQGNANGMVDCGEGNGTGGGNGARDTILNGCPLFGAPACNNKPYCGSWIPTPDGTCNNAVRTTDFPVDCVNTNNNGAQVPQCIAALIATGGTISANTCHRNGFTDCSPDHWLLGDGIPGGDPRVITTFVVYEGDVANANGNTNLPIRTFASFYVTGWQLKSNGAQAITCPPGTGANEPAPSNLCTGNGNSCNFDAIWGHWISYVEPGAGGNGQPCNFSAFGDCAVVLTR